MKGKVKSGFCVALLAMMMVFMAHCRANTSLTNNKNSSGCNGPIHECDSQLELLLDTEINVRLLAEGGGPTAYNSLNLGPVADCGRELKLHWKTTTPANAKAPSMNATQNWRSCWIPK
ncbi:hypothetical protein L1049_002549 [Liquidambar formosana]|uniref:Uncharacterized protein n=1 Tax=Liquidambar formosana TaxID=63359 RepID=A0AAP0NFV7_LIQFO